MERALKLKKKPSSATAAHTSPLNIPGSTQGTQKHAAISQRGDGNGHAVHLGLVHAEGEANNLQQKSPVVKRYLLNETAPSR